MENFSDVLRTKSLIVAYVGGRSFLELAAKPDTFIVSVLSRKKGWILRFLFVAALNCEYSGAFVLICLNDH